MKMNKWTLGLAAAGVVSLGSVAQSEEAKNSVMTALSSTTISGYVNTSIHWNPGSAPGTYGYSFGGLGAKGDGFNLDVVDLTIQKPLDEGQWSAGYKAELWFGPDANGIPGFANGLGTSTVGVTAQDFAIKNAYIALRAPIGNGVDFKVGVFDTVIGYESQNAGDNPNYTRSYGHTLEPTQHTGVLATYRFNDVFSASLGIANTVSATINGRTSPAVGVPPPPAAGSGTFGAESQKTYMASIALTAPESFGSMKGATLYSGVVDGRPTAGATPDRTWFYIGAVVPTPIEGLAVGMAYDHLFISTVTTPVVLSTQDTDAIAVYASFKATDKLTVHGRAEYIWMGGDGLAGGGAAIGGAAGPFASGDKFFAATVTLDYALWANVISRLEARWDHDLTGNPNGNEHFGGGTRSNDYLLALNLIYKF